MKPHNATPPTNKQAPTATLRKAGGQGFELNLQKGN